MLREKHDEQMNKEAMMRRRILMADPTVPLVLAVILIIEALLCWGIWEAWK